MISDHDVDAFLEHFGVKGMRWGVRKSPEQVGREREARAEKFDTRAMNMQTKIDKISARRFDPFKADKIAGLEVKKERALVDAQKKREGKLSTNQKRVAIGAGVAGGVLLAYGTYSTLSSGNARRLIGKGSDAVRGKQGLPWKVNQNLKDPNLDVDGIMSNVVSHVNPGYGKPGTKVNCRRATFAYEMRRRGYDVAATKTPTGRGQDISGMYNALNPNVNLVPPGIGGSAQRIIKESAARSRPKPFRNFVESGAGGGAVRFKQTLGSRPVKEQIVDHLFTQPNRARGELNVKWTGLPVGHSMAWEVVRGTPVVFDAQSGKSYKGQALLKFFEDHPIDLGGVTRLDNVPLNDDFLRRWVKNV